MNTIRCLLILIIMVGKGVLSAQTLTVMSYNIHHGADKNETDQLASIGAFIRSSGADLIGLQEVDSVCTRSGQVDQMKELGRITGMYYAFVRHYAYQGGAYGMGILSRYPITQVDNKRLSLLKAERSSTAMISAVVKVSKEKSIRFASVHFALDDSSRVLQATEVVKYLDTDPHPVILTGDLNATPGAHEIRYLQSYFTGTDDSGTATYPAPVAAKKIDYIFVRKKDLVHVKRHTVPVNSLSDHLPVVAVIKVK